MALTNQHRRLKAEHFALCLLIGTALLQTFGVGQQVVQPPPVAQAHQNYVPVQPAGAPPAVQQPPPVQQAPPVAAQQAPPPVQHPRAPPVQVVNQPPPVPPQQQPPPVQAQQVPPPVQNQPSPVENQQPPPPQAQPARQPAQAGVPQQPPVVPQQPQAVPQQQPQAIPQGHHAASPPRGQQPPPPPPPRFEQEVVHPDHPEGALPMNELDLPDEEYRRAHQDIHLFDKDSDFEQHDKHHQGEHDTIVEEWSEFMDDFIPDMLVTLKIPGRTSEYFYQEVGAEPVLIRGGFFVSGDDSEGALDFSIIDPRGETTTNKSKAEGLFHFNTNAEGVYAFVLSNRNWMSSKFVTFVVGTGNQTTLSIDHVNSVEENAIAVLRMVRDIRTETAYLWGRQKAHMTSMDNTNSRIVLFAFFQMLVLLALSCCQIFYIKNLVSHKRLL